MVQRARYEQSLHRAGHPKLDRGDCAGHDTVLVVRLRRWLVG